MGVEDNLISSSIEDYQNNVCAICQHDNEKWDLWQSCHHLFCQDCSSEMLSRGMNCPLCRRSSATLLRGKCFEMDRESADYVLLATITKAVVDLALEGQSKVVIA